MGAMGDGERSQLLGLVQEETTQSGGDALRHGVAQRQAKEFERLAHLGDTPVPEAGESLWSLTLTLTSTPTLDLMLTLTLSLALIGGGGESLELLQRPFFCFTCCLSVCDLDLTQNPTWHRTSTNPDPNPNPDPTWQGTSTTIGTSRSPNSQTPPPSRKPSISTT